jgi:hypothetical protein
MDIKVGSPYLWKSDIYGDTAVHVESVYNGVAMVTVDGGAASRQVREHPELAEAWPVITERLHKRPSKPRKTDALRKAFETMPETVKNTIREVPGVGKVALIEQTPRGSLVKPVTPPTGERRPKRLSLAQAQVQARKMADRNPTHFKWSASTEIEF